jgi:hypothetical protein
MHRFQTPNPSWATGLKAVPTLDFRAVNPARLMGKAGMRFKRVKE